MELISIIIPCYNEEDNIDLLMEALKEELDYSEYSYEYIFVNDGSIDKTVEKLKRYCDDESVKIIDFSRNFGKESAMLAGLDYASGDAAIIIDADLQMPLRYISEMIEYWKEGYKLVLTYKANREKGLKAKMATKYYDVYNSITEYQIIKNAMDFQLMDREVVDVMCSIRERNRFFKGLTGYIGYDYKLIPVEVENRRAGKSNFSGLETLFSYAFRSFALHSDVPLRFAIKAGLVVSCLSFIYMLVIIVQTLLFGKGVDGYASIMSVMLFMFGIVLLFMGIIGYYVGLMYDEIKQRPNYIIKEKINLKE